MHECTVLQRLLPYSAGAGNIGVVPRWSYRNSNAGPLAAFFSDRELGIRHYDARLYGFRPVTSRQERYSGGVVGPNTGTEPVDLARSVTSRPGRNGNGAKDTRPGS